MKYRKIPFRKAAVIGAGVMGAQIAAHLANAGVSVLLLDIASPNEPRNAIVDAAFKKLGKMRPAPFMNPANAALVSTGNLEDDLDKLSDVEWIIEAIVEKLDIKQQLMARLESAVSADAIISTNTSGLPIHKIVEECSTDFAGRFLGTHFFNPPRYLSLLEIIPTAQTRPEIVKKLSWYGRVHLGKNIVMAKDTPNFIANRIGTYSLLQTIRAFTDGEYTIEEIDTLTGPLLGRPKSATFRTADVVGLDTLQHVAENLYEAIPHDESRDGHRVPDLMRKLVDHKMLGAKTGKGFYSKQGKDILSVDRETLQYQAAKPLQLPNLDKISNIGGEMQRIDAMYSDTGRIGDFVRPHLLDVMGYCARRIPEIADRPVDIDNALCWGFGWEIGPFQIWDNLGFTRIYRDLQTAGIQLPDWIHQLAVSDHPAFYRETENSGAIYVFGGDYQQQTKYDDVIDLDVVRQDSAKLLIQRKEAALFDIGNQVALYEFQSKSKTLGVDVVAGIVEAIDIVESGDWKGLVIGNSGRNFSVGANLGEAAEIMMAGDFKKLEAMTRDFQDMILRVRYAGKPVVCAIQGMALGGGCELSLASAAVVAAAESYVGLVELGAGLIPAGGGTTHLTALAAERAASDVPSHIQPFLVNVFQTVATAKVGSSARGSISLNLLKDNTTIVMHADRRLYAARQLVSSLFDSGYAPPPVRSAIAVLGAPALAVMKTAAYQMQQAGYASEYDRYLAERLAYIMSGGDLSGPAKVHESYLLELEREVFLGLLGQEKTRERVKSILTRNKPLRN